MAASEPAAWFSTCPLCTYLSRSTRGVRPRVGRQAGSRASCCDGTASAPARGGLRIAVLVNEVGALDVDSALLNAKQVSSDTSSYGGSRQSLLASRALLCPLLDMTAIVGSPA